MATNGASTTSVLGPVVHAVEAMNGNADRAVKEQAVEYLDKFQKKPDAWQLTFEMLQTESYSPQIKLFAATTLKGKIVYDLRQIPADTQLGLRDSILGLLKQYSKGGPKVIRTQLNICLAQLAIRMTNWHDVLPMIMSTLGNEPTGISCILEFLKILPEEVTEGRKFNLSEQEVNDRTKELLEDNAPQVLQLLSNYGSSSASAAQDPDLIKAIDSWTREIPLADILQSPLFSVLIHALDAPESFDAAVDCLCTIIRETRDVDENQQAIEKLLPQVMTLRPKLRQSAVEEDIEIFAGIARVFAEAGDSWVLLVARQPVLMKGLVECLLQTAELDWEKDSVKHTFSFWYELKQYLTLERYLDAKKELMPVYSSLVDIMIKLLHYPTPADGNETDLFEGDRDAEEKFREFRHQMGDVLKDCCEVLGATECLRKPYELIHAWVGKYASQAAANHVPHWQELEAPIFALRAMGREVPPDENVMLPQLIPLLVQIPDHPKLRFQAVMVLGRYTEWTAQHPDTLQDQLQFIIGAFNYPSKEVLQAAALSFKFFCTDCADLLKGEIAQLQQFYSTVLDKLSVDSQEEITEGVAAVLAKQPTDQIYQGMKAFCDPVVQGILTLAEKATDKPSKLDLSDRLQLLTIFIQWIQPYVPEPGEHPAVKYCQEIFPYLAQIATKFLDSVPILERVCRCWRHMVIAYRTSIAPLIPQMAEELRRGFAESKQGCFLWATDSIIREFFDDAEGVQPGYADAVYQFYEQQATTFLRALSDVSGDELPDLIEDFFRMTQDILLYHSARSIPGHLMPDILEAATNTLQLSKQEPLMATLHFLRDFLAYGLGDLPHSTYAQADRRTPLPVVEAVKTIAAAKGEELTKRLLVGMMYTFPQDCYPDASGVILGLFQILPQQSAQWLKTTIMLLPDGALAPAEAQKFMEAVEQRVASGELRGIRAILQDFTNSYRRRNVAPRDGLGRLEATRFRFQG